MQSFGDKLIEFRIFVFTIDVVISRCCPTKTGLKNEYEFANELSH